MSAEKPAREREFIARMALTTSLVAMSLDTMLPALGRMASELGAAHANDRQLILSMFFAGLSVGQVIYGPVSDSTGRKPALYAGIGIFMIGGVICAATDSFGWLLAGRALSGLGAAGPRIVTIAIVRDVYAGRGMARVMSFVSTIFILVPVMAPSIGQAVLAVTTWRAIFMGLVTIGAVCVVWFSARQPETLPPSLRTPFSLRTVMQGAATTFRSRITLGYMVASGCVFGALIGYLSTSQQIFQEQYALGVLFPVFFGMFASAMGVASFVNARLVVRFGMRRISRVALIGLCATSICALIGALAVGGHPPLVALAGYLLIAFFCNGLLFGNFSARAMEPMGKIAGVAAAVTGTVSGIISLVLGTLYGRAYDGTVIPLVAGFTISTVIALVITEIVERAPDDRGVRSESTPAA